MGARTVTYKGSRRLGAYLHKLRTGYGYSMRRVGEQARAEGGEIDNSQLSRYEKGQCYPSFDKLRVLAGVFNVSVQSFSDMVELDAIAPIDDPSRDPEVLIDKGSVALRRGDNGVSYAYFERAIDLLVESRETARRQVLLARARINSAVALMRLGRLALAEQELRKALRLDGYLTAEQRVRALLALVNIEADQGDTFLALMGARQACATAREAGDLRLEGMSLHTLGRVLADRDRYAEAIERFREAAEVYRRSGEAYEDLRVRINIGTCYVALGKPREGVRLLRAALERARSTGHRRLEALAWSSLGEASYRMHENAGAARYFNESNALASYNRETQPDLLFFNAYYQWRMAVAAGAQAREKLAFGRLRTLRSRLERRFTEVRAFDLHVEEGQLHA